MLFFTFFEWFRASLTHVPYVVLLETELLSGLGDRLVDYLGEKVGVLA